MFDRVKRFFGRKNKKNDEAVKPKSKWEKMMQQNLKLSGGLNEQLKKVKPDLVETDKGGGYHSIATDRSKIAAGKIKGQIMEPLPYKVEYGIMSREMWREKRNQSGVEKGAVRSVNMGKAFEDFHRARESGDPKKAKAAALKLLASLNRYKKSVQGRKGKDYSKIIEEIDTQIEMVQKFLEAEKVVLDYLSQIKFSVQEALTHFLTVTDNIRKGMPSDRAEAKSYRKLVSKAIERCTGVLRGARGPIASLLTYAPANFSLWLDMEAAVSKAVSGLSSLELKKFVDEAPADELEPLIDQVLAGVFTLKGLLDSAYKLYS